MQYLNQIIIGLIVTIVGGLILYYIFGVGRKDNLNSRAQNTKNFTVKVAEEEVTFEEKMRSLKMDVVKVNAHDHFLGVQSEYSWIEENYPRSKFTGQAITKYEFATNKNDEKRVVNFDIIFIELESGRKKEIYFEIDSFFKPGNPSSLGQGYAEQKLSDIYS